VHQRKVSDGKTEIGHSMPKNIMPMMGLICIQEPQLPVCAHGGQDSGIGRDLLRFSPYTWLAEHIFENW